MGFACDWNQKRFFIAKDVVWAVLQEVLEKEEIKELQKPSWDQICLFWIGRKLDLRPDLY